MSTLRTSRSLIFVLALAALVGCTADPGASVSSPLPEAPRDGVFIHVTHGPEDAHRVLMALKMAELMAADRDVLVYFDIQGVFAVLKDAPNIEYAQFQGSQTLLDRLNDLGVPVYACPGCLAAAEKTPEDLRDGIQVANKDAFFDFTEGRILTLDY